VGDNAPMQDTVANPLDQALDDLRAAPTEAGTVELIVRRPAVDVREVVDDARLDVDLGLVGDRWAEQDIDSTPAFLQAQLTLIGARALAAMAPDRTRWAEAGDQLIVDFDLSVENLPPGTRLAVGSAIVEVSETPHTGCSKFRARFGDDALRWVNAPEGRALRLRGMNARIVESGTVRVGDAIRKA
jgi:MOSC domain-containing protein YiiM